MDVSIPLTVWKIHLNQPVDDDYGCDDNDGGKSTNHWKRINN